MAAGFLRARDKTNSERKRNTKTRAAVCFINNLRSERLTFCRMLLFAQTIPGTVQEAATQGCPCPKARSCPRGCLPHCCSRCSVCNILIIKSLHNLYVCINNTKISASKKKKNFTIIFWLETLNCTVADFFKLV